MIVEPVARLAGDGGFAAESVEAAVDMVEPGLTGIDLLVGLLKPLVKVVPLETPEAGQVRRLGFMTGQIAVPDDFDRMGETEIEQLFGSHS